jgi:hypothetical protein
MINNLDLSPTGQAELRSDWASNPNYKSELLVATPIAVPFCTVIFHLLRVIIDIDLVIVTEGMGWRSLV